MIARICASLLVLTALGLAQIPAPPPAHDATRGTHAFAGPHMEGPPHWWRNPEIAQQIGLSEAQVQKLDQMSLDHRLRMIDLRAAAEREEVRLQSLIQADNPDENQILSQIDKVSAQRSQIQKASVQMRLGMRQVLTPEQWKKFRASMPLGGPMHQPFQPTHERFNRDRHSGAYHSQFGDGDYADKAGPAQPPSAPEGAGPER